SGPFLEARIGLVGDGDVGWNGPAISTAVVEAHVASGWFACVVLEADGGVNDTVQVDRDDALVVRGSELAARPEVYNYDAELAGMCMGCMGDDSGEDVVDGVT